MLITYCIMTCLFWSSNEWMQSVNLACCYLLVVEFVCFNIYLMLLFWGFFLLLNETE